MKKCHKKKLSYSESIKTLAEIQNYLMPVKKKINLFKAVSSNNKIKMNQYKINMPSSIPVSSEKDAFLQCLVHNN